MRDPSPGRPSCRHASIVLDAAQHAEARCAGTCALSVPPISDESFFAMPTSPCAFPEVRLHMFFSSTHVDRRRDG
jgi:hypothetical protein